MAIVVIKENPVPRQEDERMPKKNSKICEYRRPYNL